MSCQSPRKDKRDSGTDLNRVVTPMLDMTFQLLFYFVIQFKPAIEEGQVDLSLPRETGGDNARRFEPVFADQDDTPEEYTIHVNSVDRPNEKPVVFENANVMYLRFTSKVESTQLPRDRMLSSMQEKLQTIPKWIEGKGAKKPPIIKLQINDTLHYDNVIVLMDVCRRIGKELNIRDISLMGYAKDKVVRIDAR